MTFSEQKIKQKVKELNGNRDDGPWAPTEGFGALMSTDVNGEQPVFNMSSGIIVKVFINKDTGELKVFPMQVFQEN